MRIAFDIDQLFYRAPGGTGRYTAELLAALAGTSTDDEVAPFSAWHRKGDVEAALGRFGVAGAGLERLARIPAPRPLLLEAWNRGAGPSPAWFAPSVRRADIVHVPFPAAPPGRAPLVVTVHDAAFALFPEAYPRRGLRFHAQALTRVSARAHLVIAPTRAAAEEIAAHSPIGPDRLRVVAHGVGHRQATPEQVDDVLHHYDLAGRPYVFWVGTLEPRKNVRALVQAFAQATRAGLPHRLALAGPLGWLHHGTIADRDRDRLGDRLRVLGAVGEHHLRALYAGASLFALPSLHEGFGLPVLEAMAQGTPVACSDLPALREVAGAAAFFVPGPDTASWAEALGRVMGDEDALAARGLAGLDRAREFTWWKAAAETRRVYLEAIERAAGAG